MSRVGVPGFPHQRLLPEEPGTSSSRTKRAKPDCASPNDGHAVVAIH